MAVFSNLSDLRPMTGNLKLSVVIPAYQEAEALELLLPKLKNALDAITHSYEVLVIDTERALDNTQNVCERHHVIHVRRVGSSYGDAVRTGLRLVRGTSVLFMDADGSHNPAEIHSLWEHRDDFILVIGSRYVAGGKTENPRILIFMSYVVNVIFRSCFSLRCRDVSNSFRLYRTEAIKDIPILSNNFDLIPELLVKICAQYGPNSVLEVPVTFEQRKKGKSKRNLLTFAFTYVSTLIRLRRLLNQYLADQTKLVSGNSKREELLSSSEANTRRHSQ